MRLPRRYGILGPAGVCLLMLGCHTLPLHGTPFVHPATPPPVHLFEVNWWTQLAPTPVWEHFPSEFARPAFDPENKRVIALTRDGVIRSVAGGKVAWSYRTAGKFNAGPLVAEGVVYAPGGDGVLYALEAKTGKLLWSYDAQEELGTTPVAADGMLLVVSEVDTIFAIDQKTGKWLWQYRRDVPSGFTIRGVSRPTVRAGVAYMGFSDGHLVALELEDGRVKWARALSTKGQYMDVDASPVLDEAGTLFAASYRDGVFALDAASGEVRWHTATVGITHLVSAGEVLFIAGDQQVSAMAATNGRWLWSTPHAGTSSQLPMLIRGALVVPTQKDLLFLDPATGNRKLAWDPGRGVSATPTMRGGEMYVLSNLGYLYALRLPGKRS